MRRILFFAAVFLLAQASAAYADMQYFSDPVYQRLNPDDPPPMQDMQDLARDGDVRAMYILGNLYAKGQGGLPQDRRLAQKWFAQSAALGYFQSFIRLAALARQRKDWLEAYKWYELAAQYTEGTWRAHAKQERDALAENKKLTVGDMEIVRKEINIWKSDMRRVRRESADQDREKEKQAREEARDAAQNLAQKKDQGEARTP